MRAHGLPVVLLACAACASVAPGEKRFAGHVADVAIAALKDDGFACWVEHRHFVPVLETEVSFQGRSRPVLFCSHWDASGRRPCAERRYAFEVGWSEPDASNERVVQQLRTQRIVREHAVCVPQPAAVSPP